MEEKKLNGKVIVVSGGTKGVGRTSSEEFARQGAKSYLIRQQRNMEE